MKVQAQEYTAELSPETIHECYRRIREFLSGLELSKKDNIFLYHIISFCKY